MISIKVDAKGLKEVRAALVNAKRDLMNRTPAHTKIKVEQIKRWRKNYAGEGSEYGAWAPSTDWTYGFGTTLKRTGGTFASAMGQADAGVVQQSATSWILMNQGGGWRGGPYPLSHHTGYPNPIAGLSAIPSRIIWGQDGKDQQRHEEIMEEYVDTVIARYF